MSDMHAEYMSDTPCACQHLPTRGGHTIYSTHLKKAIKNSDFTQILIVLIFCFLFMFFIILEHIVKETFIIIIMNEVVKLTFTNFIFFTTYYYYDEWSCPIFDIYKFYIFTTIFLVLSHTRLAKPRIFCRNPMICTPRTHRWWSNTLLTHMNTFKPIKTLFHFTVGLKVQLWFFYFSTFKRATLDNHNSSIF